MGVGVHLNISKRIVQPRWNFTARVFVEMMQGNKDTCKAAFLSGLSRRYSCVGCGSVGSREGFFRKKAIGFIGSVLKKMRKIEKAKRVKYNQVANL
jgi:hypothetical protein